MTDPTAPSGWSAGPPTTDPSSDGPPPAPAGQPTSTFAPPPAPTATGPRPWVVFVASWRLMVRSIATRGRLLSLGALTGVSLLTALAVAGNVESWDRLRQATGYADGNLASLVPVAVLVFGVATIGDLIDDGSLVYLWLRPVPSYVYVLAAWAATITVSLPLVGVPVVLGTLMIDSDPDLLIGTVLAVLVAVVGYAALFVTAGIRFRRALPWGLAYILIWEGFVASAGRTAGRLALRSYVRSILSQQTGISMKLGEFNLASGILVPLAVAALVLLYASRRLARTDVA